MRSLCVRTDPGSSPARIFFFTLLLIRGQVNSDGIIDPHDNSLVDMGIKK